MSKQAAITIAPNLSLQLEMKLTHLIFKCIIEDGHGCDGLPHSSFNSDANMEVITIAVISIAKL